MLNFQIENSYLMRIEKNFDNERFRTGSSDHSLKIIVKWDGGSCMEIVLIEEKIEAQFLKRCQRDGKKTSDRINAQSIIKGCSCAR